MAMTEQPMPSATNTRTKTGDTDEHKNKKSQMEKIAQKKNVEKTLERTER